MMEKEKNIKKDIQNEEFGPEFSPDDLDIREENDLTEEQSNNSNDAKQSIKASKVPKRL